MLVTEGASSTNHKSNNPDRKSHNEVIEYEYGRQLRRTVSVFVKPGASSHARATRVRGKDTGVFMSYAILAWWLSKSHY